VPLAGCRQNENLKSTLYSHLLCGKCTGPLTFQYFWHWLLFFFPFYFSWQGPVRPSRTGYCALIFFNFCNFFYISDRGACGSLGRAGAPCFFLRFFIFYFYFWQGRVRLSRTGWCALYVNVHAAAGMMQLPGKEILF
jgi:hypothetical protein